MTQFKRDNFEALNKLMYMFSLNTNYNFDCWIRSTALILYKCK